MIRSPLGMWCNWWWTCTPASCSGRPWRYGWPRLRSRSCGSGSSPSRPRIGRQVHRATVQLLGVDEHQAGVRPLIQGILDMARGLGLANPLGDDRQRRAPIIAQWSALLEGVLDRPG